MKNPLALSVVVPAYKQEKTIVQNIHQLIEILDSLKIPYEIICVVDGVLDETWSKAKKITSSKLKVVGYKTNRGKGCAVRYGLQFAKGNLIATIDSGNDLKLDVLRMMLEHFRWYDADIIVGSKRHPASKVTYPLPRRLMSWGYQVLVRLLFNLKIRDTQVGMKVFKREVIEKIRSRLLVKQYAFDIEMLAVANYLGFKKIYEAPVEVRLDFNKSSGIISKGFANTVFRMLWDTVAVFYRLRIRHYYDDRNLVNWHTDVYSDAL